MQEQENNNINSEDKQENKSVSPEDMPGKYSEEDIVGGVLLLRTKDENIVMQPYKSLGIVDISVFATYLDQLADFEWKERIQGGPHED